MVKEDKENDNTTNYAMLMYDVACMTSGYEVDDSANFAKRVMTLMSTGKTEQVDADISTDQAEDEVDSNQIDDKDTDEDADSGDAVEPEVIA